MSVRPLPTPRDLRATDFSEASRTRFWSKVNKSDGCWLWIGTMSTAGYGKFFVSCSKGVYPAHRVAFVLANNEIPDGLLVCHRCDNKRCVNTAHLFAGTSKDNTADMWAKGRQVTGSPEWCAMVSAAMPRGQSHKAAKLTDEKVRLMRAKWADGQHSAGQLATEFNVNDATVYRVVLRKNWTHL